MENKLDASQENENKDSTIKFKTKKRARNLREKAKTVEDWNEPTANLNFPKAEKPTSILNQSTANFGSKKPDNEDDQDSDNDDETLTFTSNRKDFFKADASETLQSYKQSIRFGATSVDQSVQENLLKAAKVSANKDVIGATGDSIYKGQESYNKYIQVDENESRLNSKMRAGPIKASSNIRITSQFDYKPDLCKDYKETGFCGYGDSCKFLHDRSDYKSGWEIERDWEIEQAKKREEAKRYAELSESEESQQSEDDDLPFACLICRKPFVDPVVTKCGHYFCTKCALARYQKTSKCKACNEPTNGTFNVAKEIIAKVERKRAKLENQEGIENLLDAIPVQVDQNENNDSS